MEVKRPKVKRSNVEKSKLTLLNFRKLMEFRSYRSSLQAERTSSSADNTSNPCKQTLREPSALSSATPVTPELLNSKKLSECET
jgi:hypothetical protein